MDWEDRSLRDRCCEHRPPELNELLEIWTDRCGHRFPLLPTRQQRKMGSSSIGRRPRHKTGTKKMAYHTPSLCEDKRSERKTARCAGRRAAAGEYYFLAGKFVSGGNCFGDFATTTRLPSAPTPNGYNGYRPAGV